MPPIKHQLQVPNTKSQLAIALSTLAVFEKFEKLQLLKEQPKTQSLKNRIIHSKR